MEEYVFIAPRVLTHENKAVSFNAVAFTFKDGLLVGARLRGIDRVLYLVPSEPVVVIERGNILGMGILDGETFEHLLPRIREALDGLGVAEDSMIVEPAGVRLRCSSSGCRGEQLFEASERLVEKVDSMGDSWVLHLYYTDAPGVRLISMGEPAAIATLSVASISGDGIVNVKLQVWRETRLVDILESIVFDGRGFMKRFSIGGDTPVFVEAFMDAETAMDAVVEALSRRELLEVGGVLAAVSEGPGAPDSGHVGMFL